MGTSGSARDAGRVSRRSFLAVGASLLPARWSPAESGRRGASADLVSVDAAVVLADVSRNPLGINAGFFLDDDANRPRPPIRPYEEALRELKVRFLRYPGGFKSDTILWSVPPFDRSRPTPARSGPEEWPAGDRTLVEEDGSWRVKPLDFDRFLGVCQAIGAEPTVVVTYSSLHWPVSAGGTRLTRQQIFDTATAWVRYANVVRRAGVKYWEIGNETYLAGNEGKMRYDPTPPAVYAADVAELSRRMKAVDPSILVGANGKTVDWWETVLERAAEDVDFLAVHTYPCWQWAGYETYRTTTPDALGPLREARAALARQPERHRGRIRLAVTEFAAGTFGAWDRTEVDAVRGLMTFDIQGQLLEEPACAHSQFWNTINVYERPYHSAFCALAEDNSLSPVGRALAIWGQFLEREMVEARGTERVRAFASCSPGRSLTLFLVNKDRERRQVRVRIAHARPAGARAARWVYRGRAPEDPRPSWGPAGPVALGADGLSTSLAPISITVMRMALRP